MADNISATPGTGLTLATDDIGGVHYSRTKLSIGADGAAADVHSGNPLPVSGTVGVSGTVPVSGPLTDAQLRAADVGTMPHAAQVSYWPGYGVPDGDEVLGLGIDPGGGLSCRAAVLTDEGTYRVNFTNASLAVSIGSVTIAGDTVTGTGFRASQAKLKDYFKLDADGESAWTQIASVDSDTQLTLVSAYLGAGTTGAASRALMRPSTGAGGTITVGSGQGTLASGTTSGAVTRIEREVDYAPLVYRGRFSVSQRIANQQVVAGLQERNTTTPRWFARFRLTGTTNTQAICESGRNPTTAPSAAETEATTITLPNAGTTAALRDWRIEQGTEAVRFYVDGVLVAEHSKVMPSAFDVMAATLYVENTGVPASTTSVVADYITTKNHNKLEIGILSDNEKLAASQVPMQTFAFTQAGVIAINTVLLTLDCLQLRNIAIQCTSMGTSGVITPEWSNDGLVWVAATISTPAGATATTFNAAGMWRTDVFARYMRLRLSTATTAGTTTLTVQGLQSPAGAPHNQPVSGTVTANIGTGSIAAGTNAIGDVGIQARANATGAATIAKVQSAATTNATVVKASAGRVLGWHFTNTTASPKVVHLHNLTVAPTVGTSVPAYNIVIPANGYVETELPMGIAHATGISYSITGGLTDLDATAVAANDVVGAIYFA